MRTATVSLLVALALATGAAAQQPYPKPELRPFVGGYVPMGSQMDLFREAFTAGAEGAVELSGRTTLLATALWSPGVTTIGGASSRVNAYMYDAGVELARRTDTGFDWRSSPFIGAGIGGRTYNYADDRFASSTVVAGYVALGDELQLGRTALRFEARDYVSRFRSPVGSEPWSTRNDITVSVGLALHLW